MQELLQRLKRKFTKPVKNSLDELESVYAVLCKTKNGKFMLTKEDAETIAKQLISSHLFDEKDLEITKIVGRFSPITHE